MQAPALDLVSESTWPAAYASDLLWQRAATGSDIDQARLAERESALGLLTALGHGGSLGRAALQALAYAPDRREARGPLCELLGGPNVATSRLLLDALFEAIVDAPRTEEAVDSPTDIRCVRSLRELKRQGTLDAEGRDRAEGALLRLERR